MNAKEIARLACLELSVEEAAAFQGELQEVVQYIEQLGSVSVEGVEPLYHPLEDQELALREDEVESSSEEMQRQLRELAPEELSGGFRVPLFSGKRG